MVFQQLDKAIWNSSYLRGSLAQRVYVLTFNFVPIWPKNSLKMKNLKVYLNPGSKISSKFTTKNQPRASFFSFWLTMLCESFGEKLWWFAVGWSLKSPQNMVWHQFNIIYLGTGNKLAMKIVTKKMQPQYEIILHRSSGKYEIKRHKHHLHKEKPMLKV